MMTAVALVVPALTVVTLGNMLLAGPERPLGSRVRGRSVEGETLRVKPALPDS